MDPKNIYTEALEAKANKARVTARVASQKEYTALSRSQNTGSAAVKNIWAVFDRNIKTAISEATVELSNFGPLADEQDNTLLEAFDILFNETVERFKLDASNIREDLIKTVTEEGITHLRAAEALKRTKDAFTQLISLAKTEYEGIHNGVALEHPTLIDVYPRLAQFKTNLFMGQSSQEIDWNKRVEPITEEAIEETHIFGKEGEIIETIPSQVLMPPPKWKKVTREQRQNIPKIADPEPENSGGREADLFITKRVRPTISMPIESEESKKPAGLLSGSKFSKGRIINETLGEAGLADLNIDDLMSKTISERHEGVIHKFIKEAIGKEEDLWVKFESDEDANLMWSAKRYFEHSNEDIARIFTGLMNINRGDVRTLLVQLNKSAIRIAKNFNLSTPEDTKQLQIITSQAMGFLYACFSYSGYNLLELSEMIFNNTERYRYNIPEYLIELGRVGDPTAASTLFEKLRKRLLNDIADKLIIRTMSNQTREIGIFGIVYLYSTLWDNAGRDEDWAVVNLLTKKKLVNPKSASFIQKLKFKNHTKLLQEDDRPLAELINQLLRRGISSETALSAFIILTTFFCDLETADEAKGTEKYAIDQLFILLQQDGHGNKKIGRNYTTSTIIELFLEIIGECLPIVIVRNYQTMLLETALKPIENENLVVKYFKGCGYNYSPLISNGGDFNKQLEIHKVNLDKILRAPGHLVGQISNVFTSNTAFEGVVMDSIKTTIMDTLRILSHIKVDTPQIPLNIGGIFKHFMPDYIESEKLNIFELTISSYLFAFAKTLIENPPRGTEAFSLICRIKLGILIDDEMITDGFFIGGAEVYNGNRDGFIGTENSDVPRNGKQTILNSVSKNITKYISFVKQLGDYFNSINADILSELRAEKEVSEWVKEHISKFKDILGEEFMSLHSDSLLKVMTAKAMIDAKDVREVVERELIEESNGSFFIFTLLALHTKSKLKRDNRLNIEGEKSTLLKVRCVMRAEFTLNLMSMPNSKIKDLTVAMSLARNLGRHFIGEYKNIIGHENMKTLGNIFARNYSWDTDKNLSKVSIRDIEAENTTLDNNEKRFMFDREERRVYIEKLRSYNLFNNGANDHLNNANKGFVCANKFNIPVEYFCTSGVNCGYFSLWVHLMTNLIKNDKSLTEASRILINVERIYTFLESHVIECKKKELRSFISPRMGETHIYKKKILPPRLIFDTKKIVPFSGNAAKLNPSSDFEEIVYLTHMYIKTIEAENISLTRPWVYAEHSSFWGTYLKPSDHPMEQPDVYLAEIIKHSIPEMEYFDIRDNLIISPQSFLRDSYSASLFLRNNSLDEQYNSEVVENLLSDMKIYHTDIPFMLREAIDDSLDSFLKTLRNYNVAGRKTFGVNFLEGVVYFSETQSFLALSEIEPFNWLKCTIKELSELVYIDVREEEDMITDNQNIIKRSPLVYTVEKNHIAVLDNVSSKGFVSRKYNSTKKTQNEVFTLTGNTKEVQRVPAIVYNETYLKWSSLEDSVVGENENKIPDGSILVAWDIESYAGEELKQVPYILSMSIFTDRYFIGSSQINTEVLEEAITKSLLCTKTFVGEDCVDEFVNFITTLFFNNTLHQFVKSVQQDIYLFTFNGTRYDHPLIIRRLIALGCDIVGCGVNDPKSVTVRRTLDQYVNYQKLPSDRLTHRRLIFNDFCALHPTGSLLGVCKQLLPNNPTLWKKEYPIANLTKEDYDRETKEITKYCEQDVKALISCILVNRTNLNKLICQIRNTIPGLSALNNPIVPHNLVRCIFPTQFNLYRMVSASQWCYEIFKTYFLPFILRKDGSNANLCLLGEVSNESLKIVKSTYYGGMTIPFIKEYNKMEYYKNHFNYPECDIQIKDINSSFPSQMIKGVPFIEFESEPRDFDFELTKGDIYYPLENMDLYFVVGLDFIDPSVPFLDSLLTRGAAARHLINPQQIYPFPCRSSKDAVKEHGLVYPKAVSNRWIWGKEINLIVAVYSDFDKSADPNPYRKAFKLLSISKTLRQNKDKYNTKFTTVDSPDTFFAEFITFFYDKKNECKTNKNLKQLEPLYKLFLNGLYGKFGQRDFPETSFCYGGTDLTEIARNPERIKIKRCGPQAEHRMTLFKSETEKNYRTIGSACRIASYVTMSARMFLWETMVRITSGSFIGVRRPLIYYCDTDSVFMTGVFPSHLAHDTKLGFWKDESPLDYVKKFNPQMTAEELKQFKATRAFFLAPKCYAIFSDKTFEEFNENVAFSLNTELQGPNDRLVGWVKTKGVSRGRIGLNEFLELVINKALKVSQLQFRRSLGDVYVDPAFEKTIRLRIEKRKQHICPLVPSSAYESIQEFEDYVSSLD